LCRRRKDSIIALLYAVIVVWTLTEEAAEWYRLLECTRWSRK